MRLFLIRHGESENNRLYRDTKSSENRSEDPALTDNGHLQAETVAGFLARNGAEFPLTHLYTSLMIRAVETGNAVARKLGIKLLAWTELHEWGGIFLEDAATGISTGLPGHPRRFFEERYPELVLPDTLADDGWWNRPREEATEVAVRARTVITGLRKRHADDDCVAFITHGGFYNSMLKELMNNTGSDGYWFHLHNTGISRIDVETDRTSFVYMNRTDFLPKDAVTL